MCIKNKKKMEIWKDVPDYDNYEISNLANIRNKKTKYLFKSKSPKQRYIQILLSKNNKNKSVALHRLVAQVFIENPENKSDVNHIDGNKRNNSVENLEWVTHSENMIHASKSGLTSTTNSQCEELELLDENNNIIKTFRTQNDAAIYFGINQEAISRIVNKQGSGTKKYKQIIMKKDNVLINTFNTNKKVGEYFGRATSIICNVLQGKMSHSKTKDYTFEIITDIPKIRKKIIERDLNEIWKDIPNYPNHQISNLGCLQNKITKKYIQGSDDGRYMRISFVRNDSHHAIHRLVAQVFIENPDNKPFVNHIDSNTYNNASNNLEWVTQSENMLHSLKSGLNPNAIKIIQYDIDGKELKIWDSLRQIEKHLNILHSTISSYCGKKQLVNNEFIFRFENSPLNLNDLPEYLKERRIVHLDGRIRVTQFNLNNIKIKDWSSISDASRNLKIDAGSI